MGLLSWKNEVAVYKLNTNCEETGILSDPDIFKSGHNGQVLKLKGTFLEAAQGIIGAVPNFYNVGGRSQGGHFVGTLRDLWFLLESS